MTRKLAVVLLASLTWAFASHNQTTYAATANRDYRIGSVDWTNGATTLLYYDIAEHNGRVGFCGYVLSGVDGSSVNIEDRMFGLSQLTLNGQSIGPAGFLPIYQGKLTPPVAAQCVQTEIAWDESWRDAELWREGPTRIRSF